MNINEWLKLFKEAWISHDVQKVVLLFSEDVEYWETPHVLLQSYGEVKSEWEGIKKQTNIRIATEVFLSSGNNHIVIWQLTYTNEIGVEQKWAGTYLIRLNEQGKCIYFYHTGEKDTK